MKALIVFAHPRKESFTHSLVKRVEGALRKGGAEVTVRDLYALEFNPILMGPDTIHIEEGRFVRQSDTYPADVQIEMDLIEESDLLIYIFPSWWNGMPAIMKGYIDRVFQHGFAYSFESDEPRKRFAQKKALFFTPTGQPQNEDGSLTPIDQAMRTLTSDWLFNSNDCQVLDHIFYGRVPYLERDQLETYLQHAEKVIKSII
ncbi:NAD(P)H-dependent oxidoreductase [Streptococcus suis]|uniref:NAD(P)H-dependent oxidoreductase n=1 Tax=Streptococcus suivaginalis TaxID=3028082 RepID=A0AA96VDC0_9STRE|nr:NAD(P)H-dependent oxidoreductase [Streptococcus sp. 29896]MCK4027840.1 NAD(P)H-dependent oxidoreductase [Streptococcus suis]WNY47617.1 NAD(P)H-dependent oxidoreductase [Streptococcus sp. 29896]